MLERLSLIPGMHFLAKILRSHPLKGCVYQQEISFWTALRTGRILDACNLVMRAHCKHKKADKKLPVFFSFTSTPFPPANARPALINKLPLTGK